MVTITQFDGYREEASEPRRHRKRGVRLQDFHAFMPMHAYFFVPTRDLWPATSVNARVAPIPVRDEKGNVKLNSKGEIATMPPSLWLDRNQSVEQVTWCPGLGILIADRLVSGGGWIDRKGVACFNLYRPPIIKPGNSSEAGPWIAHVHKVYPDDADHIILWLAHRVQRPAEKINHALVLGGEQGIGKDTLLEPAKYAVGPWNFQEVSPSHLLGRFNGFAKSVILRVSEARDLGEISRFDFYDHTKIYTAAPPDVLRVDEKHLREYDVFNCLGFIITTNHKTDGIFLPADDRRHYVAWSNARKEDFGPEYWNRLWSWYAAGGLCHVAAYLRTLDISRFDPKAPPPKTAAFWDIVDANRAPEDAELADVIDALGNPDALTPKQLMAIATGSAADWLMERKNRRVIPYRLERCGYVPVRNPDAGDGYWAVDGSRQRIYARSALSEKERHEAARKLTA